MTLITASRTQLLEDLPAWIATLEVSHVGIVPSLIEATLGLVESMEAKGGVPSTLRYIASGGEKMSDSVCSLEHDLQELDRIDLSDT